MFRLFFRNRVAGSEKVYICHEDGRNKNKKLSTLMHGKHQNHCKALFTSSLEGKTFSVREVKPLFFWLVAMIGMKKKI
jgi:hypothetical protein